MRFDVTVPAPGDPTEHLGVSTDTVAELVEHAASLGLRVRIRPHTPNGPAGPTVPAHEGTTR